MCECMDACCGLVCTRVHKVGETGLCAWVIHVCIKWAVCVCSYIFVGSGMVYMN